MSKTVFAGNIAYDVSEEQLIGIFGQVGRVVSFRLVIDRDSGRSRGYGFCEYEDADTAASAVRNLNGYEINGRSMRVDFSENDTVKPSTSSSNTNSPTTAAATDGMLGQQLPVTQSATDAITAIIGSLTANQLFDIMSQMKSLVRTSPEQARAILLQAPQISYALFQALIIMKVITPATIQQVLRASAQPPPQMAPQMHPPYPPHPHQQLPPHPQHIMMHPPAPHIMQQQQQYQNQQQQVPVQQGQASIDLNSLPEEQRAAIMQIMQLTESQIEALPPVQKQQVLLLKQQLGV